MNKGEGAWENIRNESEHRAHESMKDANVSDRESFSLPGGEAAPVLPDCLAIRARLSENHDRSPVLRKNAV